MKQCIRCNELKDVRQFRLQYNHDGTPNRSNVCNACGKIRKGTEPFVMTKMAPLELTVEERRKRVHEARLFCEWATRRANEIRSPER